MTHPHAVVWLDHREARIIDYSLDDVHQVRVRHDGAERQVHHHAGSVGSGHAKDDHHYFDQIVAALRLRRAQETEQAYLTLLNNRNPVTLNEAEVGRLQGTLK
jgi:hypothetical protein